MPDTLQKVVSQIGRMPDILMEFGQAHDMASQKLPESCQKRLVNVKLQFWPLKTVVSVVDKKL